MIEWVALGVATLSPIGAYLGARYNGKVQLAVARESRDIQQQALDEQQNQNQLSRSDRKSERVGDPATRRADFISELHQEMLTANSLLLRVQQSKVVPAGPPHPSQMKSDLESLEGDEYLAAAFRELDNHRWSLEKDTARALLNQVVEAVMRGNITDFLLRTGGDESLVSVVDGLHLAHRWLVEAAEAESESVKKQALNYATQALAYTSRCLRRAESGETEPDGEAKPPAPE